MADAQKTDPKDAEIAALKAQLAAKPGDLSGLAEVIAAAIVAAGKPAAAKLRGDKPLDEAHKGTHTYVVGPSKHYRNNRMYLAGELITVTDERPAKDWKLLDGDAKVKPAPKVASPGRAADQRVG